ncbi:MAG: hypothetical protein R3307_08750 [Anaerolineales bacterium]|nr:hypothetical protein [Anaerolineales bacterium]
MAKKKSKNKYQTSPTESDNTPASTRAMRVLLIIISIMIVLSMVLSATASLY